MAYAATAASTALLMDEPLPIWVIERRAETRVDVRVERVLSCRGAPAAACKVPAAIVLSRFGAADLYRSTARRWSVIAGHLRVVK